MGIFLRGVALPQSQEHPSQASLACKYKPKGETSISVLARRCKKDHENCHYRSIRPIGPTCHRTATRQRLGQRHHRTGSHPLVGVDTLLMISASEVGQRVAQHRNIIDPAKNAGVKHVVYTSLLHADRSTLSLAPEHVETEALLKASGLSTALLRNGWYTENYTASVGQAVSNGALIGSAGNGKIASVARADLADAAVVVLTTAGHEGKLYELAGDSAYTLTELAAEISRQTGNDIPYKDLPPAQYTAILNGAGLPAPWPEVVPAFDVAAAKGALFDDGCALSTLIGRPTTSLEDSVAAALKQG
jgi:NAD(P)H dehydrogenase (quinone)